MKKAFKKEATPVIPPEYAVLAVGDEIVEPLTTDERNVFLNRIMTHTQNIEDRLNKKKTDSSTYNNKSEIFNVNALEILITKIVKEQIKIHLDATKS